MSFSLSEEIQMNCAFDAEVAKAVGTILTIPDHVLIAAMKERGYTCYDFDTHDDSLMARQIDDCVSRINSASYRPMVKRI